MTRILHLVMILTVLSISLELDAWLQQFSRPASGHQESFETRLLGQISYQVRRIAANLLWNRMDGYMHEGGTVDPVTGGFMASYSGNEDVLALLDWIVTVDPHFIDAWSILAQYHDNMGNTARGIEMLRAAIASNPQDPQVVELLAQQAVLRIRLGERQEPIRLLQDALDRTLSSRGSSETYPVEVLRGSLINAHYMAGDLESAVAESMRGEHNLPQGHPALLGVVKGLLAEVAGVEPVPVPRPAITPTPTPTPPSHRPDGDLHHRPWMEPSRLAEIDASSGRALLAAFFTLLLSRGFRRRPGR